jgi:pimeloyl-ACP methyl ester carboxylesterase
MTIFKNSFPGRIIDGMERVTFQNSLGLTLVGNLLASGSHSIIIFSHGFGSDKHSKGRFPAIMQALYQAGYSSLAFDFSGCGESENDILTLEKEEDDLKSALKYIRSRGYSRMALYGHSLGSLISLKCWSSEIETMVLSGAVTGPVKYDWNDYYSRDQLREMELEGYFKDGVNSEWRNEVNVDRSLIESFAGLNQEKILGKVACPVLIIHGNDPEDIEELTLLENSRKGLKYLPEGSRLEVIEGAGHSFKGHLDQLVRLTCDWYFHHFKI